MIQSLHFPFTISFLGGETHAHHFSYRHPCLPFGGLLFCSGSGFQQGEDAFLETVYNSLTGQKNGKFIKHN